MQPQPPRTAQRPRSDDVAGEGFGGASPERIQRSGAAGHQWNRRRAVAYVACGALLALVPVLFGRVGLFALLGSVGAYASGRCALLLLKVEPERLGYGQSVPRLALRFCMMVLVPLLVLAMAGLYLQTRTGFPWLWTNPAFAVGLALVFLWRTRILTAQREERSEGFSE